MSSAVDSAVVVLAASVPRPVLIGILWSGTAFSLLVVAARLAIRLRLFGRFKLDDYLVLLALACDVAASIIWTVLGDDLYMTLNFSAETDLLSALEKMAKAMHGNLASYICLWTGLWSIKLSFMVFFHGLGRHIRTQRILWWCVFAYILATYATCVGLLDYRCLTSDGSSLLGSCNNEKALDYEYANTRVTTVLDVTTDALIVLVSASIVWRVNLPWQNKTFLGFICSLTVSMMVIAVIRITVGAPGKAPDLSWLLLWNSVEMTLAIFVACIASFRSLYCYNKTTKQSDASPSDRTVKPPPRRTFLSSFDIDTILSAENSEWDPQTSHDSREAIYRTEYNEPNQKTTVSCGIRQWDTDDYRTEQAV